MIEHSDNLDLFAPAFVKAQSLFSTIKRDADGQMGNRKYRYATLENIDNAVRPVLEDTELSYSQDVEPVNGMLICTTEILHSSGQWRRTRACVPIDPTASNQDLGIDTSYVRRYGLSAGLGIVVEDDTDGAKGKSQGTGKRTYPKDDPLPPKGGEGDRVTAPQVRLFHVLTKGLSKEAIQKGMDSRGFEGMGFGDLSKSEGSQIIDALKKAQEEHADYPDPSK